MYVGTVKEVRKRQEFEKFTKREFVLHIASKYPKNICVTCYGELADKCGDLVEGQELKVDIDVSSRYWPDGDKWFTEAKATHIEEK